MLVRFYTFSLLVFILLSSIFSYAQDTITYFNKAMETVCCRDSASFYRIGINDHGLYRDTVRDYFITGELFQEGFYPQWRGMGQFTGYYKNGKKSYEATLMNDEYNLVNRWDSAGVKILKRGTGLSISYYHYNMHVIAQGNYKAGHKIGPWFWNNFDGKKIEDAVYENDGKLTAYNAWDEVGEKQLVVNGTGKRVRYFTNGTLKFSDEWKNNKREGKWIWYYENGKIRFEGSIKEDKREGNWKWYYNNGVCSDEYTYLDGVLHGPIISRNSKGIVTCKGKYTFGNRTGYWEWYTDEGLPKSSFNYN